MEGDFLWAAVFPVVLLGDDMDSVRRKLAKESRGLLIFSDFFQIKDGIQLIQSLLRIPFEGRDVLLLLFRFGYGLCLPLRFFILYLAILSVVIVLF